MSQCLNGKLQVERSKDQVLRTLADMENLRERSARQIDTNKQFAVQVQPDLHGRWR